MNNLDSIVNLARSGQIESAGRACDAALETEPDSPELLHLRGLLFSLANRQDDAISFIHRAIQQRPQPKYWSNLGNALAETGHLDEAERAYRNAIALDASFTIAWFNLGKLFLNSERLDDAAEAMRHVTRLDPADVQAWTTLGEIHEQRRRFVEAREVYEQGFASTKGAPDLAALIAYCLERENRLDDARRMAEISLAGRPGNHLGNLVMAILDRRAGRKAEARARLLAMSDSGMTLPHQAQREHELGVLDDQANEYDSACLHFARAKALQAEVPAFAHVDGERYLDRLNRLIELDYSWMAERSDPVDDGMSDPIFIVGFPRSGTTLLNQFLNGHPQLYVMEEIPLLATLERQLFEMQFAYPVGLPTMPEAQARSLRRQYFELARAENPDWDGKKRLIDKFPLNIQRLPLAVRLFPGARVLLSLRHPCDACLSGFMHLFSPNDAMANFADLRSAATLYDRIFTLWNKMSAHLPVPWMPVKYESLIADPEGQMRAVIGFLGLPWANALLDHTRTIGTRGRINTPSYQQVARPLHRESMGRWRSYAPYFKPVEHLLRPHAKAWEYDL